MKCWMNVLRGEWGFVENPEVGWRAEMGEAALEEDDPWVWTSPTCGGFLS